MIDVNRNVSINWGTFNVPTLIAVLGVLWYTATGAERRDARLDALEINNVARSSEVNKTLDALQVRVTPLDNLTYRVTVLEQNINDANRRIDRQTDSLQGIRDDIGALSANFQVLSEKIESMMPPKRASLMQNAPPRD